MKHAKYVLILLVILILPSCDNSSDVYKENIIEKNLTNNTKWPYLIVGVLDIAYAGDYDGSSDYPSFAMGQIDTGNKVDDISFNVDHDVLQQAGIDIDSGEVLKIWLAGPPKYENGINVYQVAKLERN